MSWVTVLVPAYKPGKRFTATMASLAAQTHRELMVHVSLDHGDDRGLPPLPEMGRVDVTITRQPRRLGWVGNVNTLVAEVKTPYFMVIAHDDCITPCYIEKAIALLAERPATVAAHGVIRWHGIRDGEVGQVADNVGEPIERVLKCIERGPHLALGWRGVVRTDAIERGLRLRTRRSDGLFSNHLWEVELLLQGDTAAIDDVFYDKYTDPMGLSRTYHQMTVDQKSMSLADNVAALAEMVATYPLNLSEQEEIVAAYVRWLLDLQGNWNVLSGENNVDGMPYSSVKPALARFAARIGLNATMPPLEPTIVEPPVPEK
jgi:glycosyltransferase involved in cell wall biosynthesis